MNIQFIKYFVVLSETQSFTKAAEKMFVVQSTFSAGIKKLEEHFDCKLFHRDKRNVSLTKDGEALLPKAKQLLSLWNSIETDFENSEVKSLKVGVLDDLISDAFVPMLKSFKELHGHIKVEIIDNARDVLVERLVKQELDAIFIDNEHIDPINFDKKLVYEEILEIAVPKNHFLANKEQLELKAIHQLPFIERCNCKLFNEVQSTLDERDIKLEKVFSAKTNETAASLVNSDLGITLLARPEKEVEGVKFIPICDADFVREIVLVWRRDNKSKALEFFIG
ncbi:LysR family transcriptional regulator [Marinifilum sp. D714]|uniref:LysR family transcriptional regulator n=1 Tax=Marinifilum sp. D714 TaxID=2937523 RepID=UPI0027D0D244|nr:LysR family transcriptional regulator [Marinifilum sp. D714]MDQ2177891.1 LysR family transcriptional regulator [Marinifilum sp. D714]